MAHNKNQCMKFVFFLFCLLQTQAMAKNLIERSDSPFDELFKEISKSVNKISEKLQWKLDEVNIHVDKYVDQFKEKVQDANGEVQESIQKMEESLEKFQKQLYEVIPNQIDRLVNELKARDPQVAEKVKLLRTEFIELKESILALYEDLKKKLIENYNILKDEAISKAKPIAKRLTPIIKDVEEIILTLIPDKKKAIQ